MMELYQLRSFVAVAEEGHLTRASERLFSSQPTVSSHIKALEEQLGLRLFDRTARGMQLTEDGQVMLDHARAILKSADGMTRKASAIKAPEGGLFRLGINNALDFLRADQVVAHMVDRYPRLKFQIDQGSSGAVLAAIARGDLDAGFYEGENEYEEIEGTLLSHVPIGIVIPKQWSSEFQEADWGRLQSRPWVFVSTLCSYYRLIERLERQHQLQLDKRFEVSEDQASLSLVARCVALSVLSIRHVEESPLRDRVELWPHFRHAMPLHIAYRRDRADETLIRSLVSICQEVWGQPQAPLKVQSNSLIDHQRLSA
ncbi:DNA-binding transcriptional regulator, LysR family [Prosthecobacter debontii]|uniref:DNA-binding transcriptional regulator, LysR family n=2 Tax=Prosthecobacter debontii TaxID=48467 RepID=A0A1T4YZL2_9BACT|nr:DNA-binding transcriptional regulator, LysR family [Prosthecobacter debontii]